MPPVKPPITSAEIPPDWPEQVRSAINEHAGQQVRAGRGNTIEAWSATYRKFIPLMLPGGGVEFASEADRDAVLAQIANP